MAWWPFKRRAAPTPPETPQSPAGGDSVEDWAVGDIAECIAAGVWLSIDTGALNYRGPKLGDCFRVIRVDRASLAPGWHGPKVQYLVFSRWPSLIWQAAAFRKITPKADAAERADADFIQQIKPKVVS